MITRKEVLDNIERAKDAIERIKIDIEENSDDLGYVSTLKPLIIGYSTMIERGKQWLKENPSVR